MRYFFDTEFIDDGKTIDLISIGIVSEDGREYYAINYDCDFSKASPWVWQNVLYQMGIHSVDDVPMPRVHRSVEAFRNSKVGLKGWRSKALIASEVMEFVYADIHYDVAFQPPTPTEPIEFWAYYADYDWVVFCQLFGAMIDLPKRFPKYCLDLKQWSHHTGYDVRSVPQPHEHHALEDARWVKKAWEWLNSKV